MALEKWFQRGLETAHMASTWSKDPTTGVGAAIFDRRHRLVSVGFNGLPHGVKDAADLLEDRDSKLACILHAEENAILFARQDLSDCVLFVVPLLPCAGCASRIIQSGIRHVVALEADAQARDRWAVSTALTRRLFAEAGVHLTLIGEHNR